MKILVFSWRDPKHPLAGGAEQVMHEHMKGWVQYGHTVTLFTSHFNKADAREDLDGVEVIRSGYQYLGVQVMGFIYYLLHAGEYDFIIDQFHGIPFFTPLFSNKPKLAVIQETAREVWFLNPLPFPINYIVGLMGYITEPIIFLIYKSTIFMTGSDSAKKDVLKMGVREKNIHIIPHGVIVNLSKVSKNKENIPTIIFLGVLSKDKGISDAIRCFANLKTRGEYRFWVVGRTETREYGRQIQHLVRSLGMDSNIEFFGFVSQEKKFELLSRAHVLINPSVKEGWGLVNIEANSVRTPVIAYNSEGLIDSVKQNLSGIIVNKNTPEDLANAVLELIHDNQKYKAMCASASEWSKRFSWIKSKDLSLKLIEQIYVKD